MDTLIRKKKLREKPLKNLGFIGRIRWLFRRCPTCGRRLYKYDWGKWQCEGPCNVIWEWQSIKFKG